MVNYPNLKKATVHQTKLIDGKLNTRHRGMNLEEDLNLTNKYYLAGVLQLNNINFFETLDIALFFCQFFCIFYSYFLVLCDIIVSGGVSYG